MLRPWQHAERWLLLRNLEHNFLILPLKESAQMSDKQPIEISSAGRIKPYNLRPNLYDSQWNVRRQSIADPLI